MQLTTLRRSKVNEADDRLLCTGTGHLKKNRQQCSKSVTIEMETVGIVILSDSSFANTKRLESQLDYLVLMTDMKRTTNTVHYGSKSSHRVSGSGRAEEVQAWVHAFDISYIICDTLQDLLRGDVELESYVDWCTLFNVVVKDGSIVARRIQIDIFRWRRVIEEESRVKSDVFQERQSPLTR